MKDLTNEKPKCLLEIRGKSLLERQVSALNGAGINEIAIVTGYRRDLLSGRGFKEFFNPRWAETQMVSSLACANEWLQNEPCIVSYSDIFYEYTAVVSLIRTQADIAITYDPNWLELWKKRFGDPLLDAETFRLNEDSTLAEIGNKPKTVSEVQGQYMGLLRYTPVSWAEVLRLRAAMSKNECDRMHMTGLLQKVVVADRIKVRAIAYSDNWGEVDSIDDLVAYE
jgi:choline kinase